MQLTPSATVPEPSRRLDDRLRDWRRVNRVSIYGEEAARISRFVMAYPNLETGGDLFGFWTNSGAPVISYVIGPGRRSTHRYTSFYQDEDWLREAGTSLYDRHGLQHIGEWHSHHRLGLNKPSAGDIRTVVRGLAAKNWAKFVLMIATRDADAGSPVAQNYYLVNPDGEYKPLRPRALAGGSPFRTGPVDPREESADGAAAHGSGRVGAYRKAGEESERERKDGCDGNEVDAYDKHPATLPIAPTTKCRCIMCSLAAKMRDEVRKRRRLIFERQRERS